MTGELDTPEPMQLGRARLSPRECSCRLSINCCLYCGAVGQYIATCPVKRPEALVGASTLVSLTGNPLCPITQTPFYVGLLWGDQSKSLWVLIASGADESFMDATLVSELSIPTQLLSVPMDARALEGLSIGRVTHSTVFINIQVSGNHSESIQLLLIKSSHIPDVLGFSWLQKHDPDIDWTTGSILGWSSFCHSHCLKAAQPLSMASDLSAVPAEYHDLLEVFSNTRATSLPPRRPLRLCY